MGHGFLGRFSQLIFVNPTSSTSDTQLGNIIGDITTEFILKNAYNQYIWESKPSSLISALSNSNHYGGAVFVVREEALTQTLINSSSTKSGNLLMVTSNRDCGAVQKEIFSYLLRLDSLCFALCSSTGNMRRVIELYKVYIGCN